MKINKSDKNAQYTCDIYGQLVMQCNYQATSKGNLNKYRRSVHEGVKFPCSQRNYKATTAGSLKNTQKISI